MKLSAEGTVMDLPGTGRPRPACCASDMGMFADVAPLKKAGVMPRVAAIAGVGTTNGPRGICKGICKAMGEGGRGIVGVALGLPRAKGAAAEDAAAKEPLQPKEPLLLSLCSGNRLADKRPLDLADKGWAAAADIGCKGTEPSPRMQGSVGTCGGPYRSCVKRGDVSADVGTIPGDGVSKFRCSCGKRGVLDRPACARESLGTQRLALAVTSGVTKRCGDRKEGADLVRTMLEQEATLTGTGIAVLGGVATCTPGGIGEYGMCLE